MRLCFNKRLNLLAMSLFITACIAPASHLAFASTGESAHLGSPSAKMTALPAKGRLLLLYPTSKSIKIGEKCNAVAGFFYGSFSDPKFIGQDLGPVLLVGTNYMKNIKHQQIGFLHGAFLVVYHKCQYNSTWAGPFMHKNKNIASMAKAEK